MTKQPLKRGKTPKNIYDQRFEELEFDGIWHEVFGMPEPFGFWQIYGSEKHGKTWMALLTAKYLSDFAKVMYVSAEEGTSRDFVNACERAGIDHKDRIHFYDYLGIDEIEAHLRKKHAPRFLFIDNTTMYEDELTKAYIRYLLKTYRKTLWIWLSHEERNEPYPAIARLISKLAKVRMRVIGLTAFIGGRVTGGAVCVDEEKAALYHGQSGISN